MIADESMFQSHSPVVCVLLVWLCRVMAVPATVIYFTCYDQLRDFLRFSLGLQGSYVPLVAGAVARCESS